MNLNQLMPTALGTDAFGSEVGGHVPVPAAWISSHGRRDPPIHPGSNGQPAEEAEPRSRVYHWLMFLQV